MGVSGKKNNYSLAAFRILIVEDYPFMVDLLASMMREFGVGHLFMAESGNDAKNIIARMNKSAGSGDNIDLVVTDWLMPDGDGENLVRWIRDHQSDSIRFLPVILCSAYTSEEVVTTGRDSGANEVLVKPLSAKKLANRILHVIDHPRPFIKTASFFGPDRRRQDKPCSHPERRVTTQNDIREYNERL